MELYESSLDALLALHEECSTSNTLSKDQNVVRFLNKYNTTVEELRKQRLSIDDFELKNIIGQGHFGEVCMVREKATGDVFAMKIMRKAHVLQQADAAFFLEERDIMAQANSQWLASLHYAFQDREKLYLVMEFYPGGDLLTIMQRYEGQLTEQQARFYLSEIIAGLNDLHQLGFVHRDVKPENVLITKSGHIKLIDFGSATRVDKNSKVYDSKLPVGTPEYISPEVLTSLDHGARYGVDCDWWSVGIILYEIISDCTPFEGDTTAQTYCNIMSYKTSLQFPDDVAISDDARNLIYQLLVESTHRLQYSAITGHPFFSTVDWDHLAAATPPFVPTISGPDDTSNFDSFDPKEDDSFATSKKSHGFSGRSLPFVGFTYTGHPSGTRSCDQLPSELVHNLKTALDVSHRECYTAQERQSALERECVVYKSQLEDLQRKLNIERTDRRMSDSRALQLLAEIKEKAQVAEDLRQTEAKATHDQQLAMVVTQLEQEKGDLSRRLQRLQGDLKKRKIESDNAIGKVTDLRNRMAQMKEAHKKDLATLQAKLAQVTESCQHRIVELQTTLLASCSHESQLQQQIAMLNNDLKAEKLKTQDCDNLQSRVKTMEEQLSDLVKDKAKIEARVITTTTELEAAHTKLSNISHDNNKMAALHNKLLSEKANTEQLLANAEQNVRELTCALENRHHQSSLHDNMKKRVSSLEQDKLRLQQTISSQRKEYEESLLSDKQEQHQQVTILRDELARLKRELSEVTSSALRSAERLSELRKTKQTLESENHCLQEASLQQSIGRDSLVAENKRLKDELVKSEQSVFDYKKKFEEQELSLVLLKRNVQSLESQLADASTVAEESNAATAEWRESRKVLESDLEQAETKLDNMLQTLTREKDQRLVAEGQVAELRTRLEELVASRAEEESQYKQLLNQQRQTAEQCSEQLAVLQKELGLSQLKLKESQHELSIEKSLCSKIYDDYHSLGREHGKLKAAHLKVSNQLEQQTVLLEEVSHEKEQVVKENINMTESLAVERVRLQTQTAQFTKLVDYQHTPLSRSSFRKSMRRKTRDPERELVEWNKLKGMSQQQLSNVATPTSRPPPVDSGPSSVLNTSHVMEHNIPHRFITKSGPFHKSSSCSTCNTAIKVTQKLAKCTYCGLTCHYKCVSSTPNTCGLPSELADHLHPPAAKRLRTDSSKENIDHQACLGELDMSITSSMLAGSTDDESDII